MINKKQYRDKEWLYKKYIEEKLTTTKIGELCKSHNSTICNWLKKYNIPIRTTSETSKGCIPWNKGLKVTDDIRVQNFVEAGHKSTRGKPSWNKGIKEKTNTGRTHFKKGHIPFSKGLFGVNNPCWRGGIIIARKKHKEKYIQEDLEYYKQYRKNNRERLREVSKRWCKNKRLTDIKFNLNHKMGSAIRTALKKNKNGYHWETLVKYTLTDLIKRLNETMPKGYTWKNVLSGELQIDHIIPVSVFNFDKPEHIDFQRCWSLNNLQLLPAKENIIKSNHLEKPFQPALKL